MDDIVLNGIHNADEKCALGYKAKLLFEDEMNSYMQDGVNDQPVLREVIQLKDDRSREDIKQLYQKLQKAPIPEGDQLDHPSYISETLKISTCEDMSEFWNMVAEAIPEDPDYKEIAQYWIESVQRKNDRFDELEANIRDLNQPDLITLAGIPSDAEEDIIRPPAQQEVKEEIISDNRYPENFELDFSGEYLTINKVPTNIATVFIKNTYVGLAGLLSHDRAIRIVSKIIRKKISPLFEVKQ